MSTNIFTMTELTCLLTDDLIIAEERDSDRETWADRYGFKFTVYDEHGFAVQTFPNLPAAKKVAKERFLKTHTRVTVRDDYSGSVYFQLKP